MGAIFDSAHFKGLGDSWPRRGSREAWDRPVPREWRGRR